MDATGCSGRAQAAPGCVPWCAAATLLLGIAGLAVTAVAPPCPFTVSGDTASRSVTVRVKENAHSPALSVRRGSASDGQEVLSRSGRSVPWVSRWPVRDFCCAAAPRAGFAAASAYRAAVLWLGGIGVPFRCVMRRCRHVTREGARGLYGDRFH